MNKNKPNVVTFCGILWGALIALTAIEAYYNNAISLSFCILWLILEIGFVPAFVLTVDKIDDIY